eukprot:jgi/Tetstr1/436343/TSEL_025180.t1
MKNEMTSFGVCSGSIAMQYSAKMVLPRLQNTFPEAERDTKSSHGVSCRSGKIPFHQARNACLLLVCNGVKGLPAGASLLMVNGTAALQHFKDT